MSHTPRPWTVIQGSKAGYSVFVRDHPYRVAGQIESDDNAQLIAAAPDLLAALKEIVKESEAGRYTYDVLGMARAAIRKAEGGV